MPHSLLPPSARRSDHASSVIERHENPTESANSAVASAHLSKAHQRFQKFTDDRSSSARPWAPPEALTICFKGVRFRQGRYETRKPSSISSEPFAKPTKTCRDRTIESLLTVQNVASKFQVTARTVRNLMKDNQLAASRYRRVVPAGQNGSEEPRRGS
jgi:hypothetical protein